MPTDVLPPPLGQDGEPTGEEEVAEAAGCWFVEASDGAAASQRLTGAWEGCKPGWAAAERHAGQSLLRLDLAAAAEGAARGAAEGAGGAAAEGAAAAAEEEGMYWLDVCPPAGGAISPPHLPHTSPTPPPHLPLMIVAPLQARLLPAAGCAGAGLAATRARDTAPPTVPEPTLGSIPLRYGTRRVGRVGGSARLRGLAAGRAVALPSVAAPLQDHPEGRCPETRTISPYLPVSAHISPYLPVSPRISVPRRGSRILLSQLARESTLPHPLHSPPPRTHAVPGRRGTMPALPPSRRCIPTS